MKNLIITHPGSAHFDDFTAVSLILASHPDLDFAIERRDPTPAELDDADVWVVDIGHRLQPELKNFDHHQGLDVRASFVLVAEGLGVAEELALLSWWDFKDSVDRFGMMKTCRDYEVGNYVAAGSPLEAFMVDAFAADPAPLIPIMRAYGASVIAQARHLARQLEFWAGCDIIKIGRVRAIVGDTDDSTGLHRFRDELEDKPEIAISRDRRGGGWRLYRFDGVEVIDFARLIGDEKINFAHKGGFMAKTKPEVGFDELAALIEKAQV